jgi:hypothetical protein
MSRLQQIASCFVFLAAALVVGGCATSALADPLPGRDQLKFSQVPMVQTNIPNNNGVVDTFFGHDELSTAYGFPTTVVPSIIPFYSGRFMADDFADNLSSPVLHVKWWGSYLHDLINPNMPVNKFLISFEADDPANAANPFSQPGQPLLNQVVTRGALAPGSGTFTETSIRGADPTLGESLYEYNAELNLGKDFPEKQDTVYWLKIAALVDVPAGITFDPHDPANSPIPITQWGWHNRDYTVNDPFASPNVSPGEVIDGGIGSANQPIWHFQDDAVSGDLRVDVLGSGGLLMPDILQTNMQPQHYLDFIDGPGISMIPGQQNIGVYSKDLAFQLFTYANTMNTPEPSSCVLMVCGVIGLILGRRRRTRG